MPVLRQLPTKECVLTIRRHVASQAVLSCHTWAAGCAVMPHVRQRHRTRQARVRTCGLAPGLTRTLARTGCHSLLPWLLWTRQASRTRCIWASPRVAASLISADPEYSRSKRDVKPAPVPCKVARTTHTRLFYCTNTVPHTDDAALLASDLKASTLGTTCTTHSTDDASRA